MIYSPQPRAVWIFGIILLMMRIGMMPEQGDIVLIPVPFTDLSSHKRRPVIVISNDAYNRRTSDIVVVAVTSNPAPVQYGFTITSSVLPQGALKRPSAVLSAQVSTLSRFMAD